MFDRISRSWQLVKASAGVLSQDRELLVFPLISSISALLLMACFALPIFGLGALDGMANGENSAISVAVYALAFVFYVCLYFVIFFFNAALVGAAMIRFDGGDPTVSDGLRIASGKFVSILGYAIIAATVGMILRAIQERVGFLGKIIVGLLGAGWTIATYLVVPILVTRDVGPIDAVKESAMILKKTWGENIVGQAGIGAAFGLIYLLVVICGIVLIVGAAASGSGILLGLASAITVLAIVVAALVQSALAGIYSAALYRYASSGEGSVGFDSSAMQLAFAQKS
ncbi:DUF6159 family protein [soil metagenome]